MPEVLCFIHHISVYRTEEFGEDLNLKKNEIKRLSAHQFRKFGNQRN